MTYWQGLFVIGLQWFILGEVTRPDDSFQRIFAGLCGIAFTGWAGYEMVAS